MHMIALRVIALLLLASTADQVAGQTPERVRLEEILTAYHALLDAYQQGDNKSVVEIGTWEQKRVMEAIGSVHTAGDIVREWDQGHFKAAAMLHTDAAMEKLEADEPQAAFHLQVACRTDRHRRRTTARLRQNVVLHGRASAPRSCPAARRRRVALDRTATPPR